MQLPCADYVGEVMTFYVPAPKLDQVVMVPGMTPGVARAVIHDYFMGGHNAYTHEASRIQGWWREAATTPTVCDAHERYEVAVRGKDAAAGLSRFLSSLCRSLGETAIYLVSGSGAWLIRPRDDDGVAEAVTTDLFAGVVDPLYGPPLPDMHWSQNEAGVWLNLRAAVADLPSPQPLNTELFLATVQAGPWEGRWVATSTMAGGWAVCELGIDKYGDHGWAAFRLADLGRNDDGSARD